MKRQGVKVIDMGRIKKGGEIITIEQTLDSIIKQLNDDNKTVVNITCSTVGSYYPITYTILYEYE